MSQKEKEVKQSAAEVENENLETEHTEADNGETSAGTENQEAETRENEAKEAKDAKKDPKDAQIEELQDRLKRQMAEFDNFRKRSVKEKDGIYQEAKAETAKKFLPVYDNLERALKNETADEAYKKGVEMTMTGLVEILKKLEVTVYGAPGDLFDPNLHNAVMHIEDENLGENVVAEEFQKGYVYRDSVVRHSMVKVAN